jgi:hypothetical protein
MVVHLVILTPSLSLKPVSLNQKRGGLLLARRLKGNSINFACVVHIVALT